MVSMRADASDQVRTIGILGAGKLGTTLARLALVAGYRVLLSASGGPERIALIADVLAPGAEAVTAREAAEQADVVVLAAPLGRLRTLPADELRGKIVIDALNYYPGRDGQIAPLDAGELTSSELVARHLPGARLVKAFNTIWFEHLRTLGNTSVPPEQRRAIFVSGDDAEAKGVVSRLIEEIGFGAYDLGSLRDSHRQQPGAAVYNRDVTVAEARGIAG